MASTEAMAEAEQIMHEQRVAAIDSPEKRAEWLAGAEQFARTQCLPTERVPNDHPARAWTTAQASDAEALGRSLLKPVRVAARLYLTDARKDRRVTDAKRAERWIRLFNEAARDPKWGTPTPDRWLTIARMVSAAMADWLSGTDFQVEVEQAVQQLLEVDEKRNVALTTAAADAVEAAVRAEIERRNAEGAWESEVQRRAQQAQQVDAGGGPAAAGGDGEPPMYDVVNGCLTWNKRTATGTDPVMLATFDAEIAEEVICDDGTDRTLVWDVRVTAQDGTTRHTQITPDQLGRPQQWATKAVGISALVMPGVAVCDHLRVAVQSRSKSATRRTVFLHTGWRRFETGWAYLSSTGALGANGLDAAIAVELGPLAGFALPDLRTLRGIRGISDMVRASLKILCIATDDVVVPLLAAAYRAALPLPPDCSVWLFGRSGTFKTAITAVIQQHYGALMGPQNLPGNWTSTANALETQAHSLVNALFVVDDYSPDATEADAKRRAAAADRLMRGSANQSGRGRANPDGTLKAPKPPRSQVLTSAEDIPPSIGSLRARVVVTEINPGAVKVATLTEAQKHAVDGDLAGAMAGYVQWLAARYDADPAFPATLEAKRNQYRDAAQAYGQHPRVPLNIASLGLGWAMWLDYAREVGAIDDQEHEELSNRAWKALTDVGAAQERYRQDADPVSRYLGAISAMIASGRAYIANLAGNAPAPDPSRWGWAVDAFGEYKHAQSAVLVGWTDGGTDGDVYLHPEVAYNAARRFAEESGATLGVTKRAIHAELKSRGLLASTSAPDRHTAKKNAGGKQRDLLHLTRAAFDRDGGE